MNAGAVTVKTPMQYLDKAVGALRDLGLQPGKAEDAPINALLQKISDLDQDKIAVIARTLGQASVFNEIVREQTAAMDIGNRYQEIAASFNSIRDDAKKMVDQIADGKLDILERVTNAWMKISRGDIADRFDRIRDTYLAVSKATKDQIEREAIILDAYRDFRGALKQAEVLALEVLKTAEERLKTARPISRARRTRSPPSPAANRPSAPSSNSPATSICAARRTRTSATRSPRISPTTSPCPTTRPR